MKRYEKKKMLMKTSNSKPKIIQIIILFLGVSAFTSCLLSEDPIQHDNRFYAAWKLDSLQYDSVTFGTKITFSKQGTFSYQKMGYNILDAKWKTKGNALILNVYLGIEQNGTWNENYEYQYQFSPNLDTLSLFQEKVLRLKYFKIPD
jgi:hypothetical protein